MNKEKDLNELELLYEEAHNNYDDSVQKINKIHYKYVEEFEKSMIQEKLSKKAIRMHRSNAYYLCDYLAYYLMNNIFTSYSSMDDFIGYFYIHKTIPISLTGLNELCSSMNKFFKFMYANNYINEEECYIALQSIKENKLAWKEELIEYLSDEDYFF